MSEQEWIGCTQHMTVRPADEQCPRCELLALREEVERLRERWEWWEANAIQWREQCEKAWSQKGSAIGRAERLEQAEARLNQRWAFIKSDPESARHMLLLLSEGKGTEDDFDRMIDRLIASKAEAQQGQPAEEKGDE